MTIEQSKTNYKQAKILIIFQVQIFIVFMGWYFLNLLLLGTGSEYVPQQYIL